MIITQHAHIYSLHTSKFNFGEMFFLIFLSIQPPPPGRYGANTRPMAAASSGISGSPRPAILGDALGMYRLIRMAIEMARKAGPCFLLPILCLVHNCHCS